MEDVATLRTVIGASCETSASLSATRDGRFVAYAADKAAVVASLDDPDGSSVDRRRQILSGHAEAVTCVAFSVCGTELITAQKGPFPCVSVYRAVSYAGVDETDETDENATFFLRASFRASCASATALVTAQKKGGGTRLALLGETPAGSFQKASIEVWDWDYVTGTGTTPPAKILSCVSREMTRATCVAFSPDRDDRLFVCGDGFVTEATLALDPASRSMRLIEKPVCFKDLDLAALGGDASADGQKQSEPATRAFTTLAFLVERETATDANGWARGRQTALNPKEPKKHKRVSLWEPNRALSRGFQFWTTTIPRTIPETRRARPSARSSCTRAPSRRWRFSRRNRNRVPRARRARDVSTEPTYPYLSQKRSP